MRVPNIYEADTTNSDAAKCRTKFRELVAGGSLSRVTRAKAKRGSDKTQKVLHLVFLIKELLAEPEGIKTCAVLFIAIIAFSLKPLHSSVMITSSPSAPIPLLLLPRPPARPLAPAHWVAPVGGSQRRFQIALLPFSFALIRRLPLSAWLLYPVPSADGRLHLRSPLPQPRPLHQVYSPSPLSSTDL